MTSQVTILFNPQNTSQTTATFAFYVANNNIDNQALQAFQVNTQAKLLIALVTENAPTANLDLADTVIHCQVDEVENVIKAFETFFTGETFISIDTDEALVFFANLTNIYFYQATGKTVEQATQNVLANIKSDVALTKLCVLVQGKNVGFEEFSQITETVATNIQNEKLRIIYALDMVSEDTSVMLFAVGV